MLHKFLSIVSTIAVFCGSTAIAMERGELVGVWHCDNQKPFIAESNTKIDYVWHLSEDGKSSRTYVVYFYGEGGVFSFTVNGRWQLEGDEITLYSDELHYLSSTNRDVLNERKIRRETESEKETLTAVIKRLFLDGSNKRGIAKIEFNASTEQLIVGDSPDITVCTKV
jgi:hypothetical protein